MNMIIESATSCLVILNKCKESKKSKMNEIPYLVIKNVLKYMSLYKQCIICDGKLWKIKIKIEIPYISNESECGVDVYQDKLENNYDCFVPLKKQFEDIEKKLESNNGKKN
jgi:hypothetical protein